MSRARRRRKDLRNATRRPDVDGLNSPEPNARGAAVRSCCPCRVGWDVYEAHRDAVERLCKDEDATVRFNALHVLDDAARAETLTDGNERRRAAAAARARRAQEKREVLERTAARAAKRATPSSR